MGSRHSLDCLLLHKGNRHSAGSEQTGKQNQEGEIEMAHKDWCGNTCADCATSCELDESLPCSPDCENLNADGSRKTNNCKKEQCDAVNEETYDYKKKQYDAINEETYECTICHTKIGWQSGDDSHGSIWACEACSAMFCQQCFITAEGKTGFDETLNGDTGERILCPACYEKWVARRNETSD
jgi:hypothetical protein